MGYAFADLERKVVAPDVAGLDRLRLVEVPFVPEVRLDLAEDAIVVRARQGAAVRVGMPRRRMVVLVAVEMLLRTGRVRPASTYRRDRGQ